MQKKLYDLSKEQTVLGSLIFEDAKEVIAKVVRILGTKGKSVFYGKYHPEIYQAIVDLYSQGKPVEIPSVEGYLKEKFGLEGHKSYLRDLFTHDLGKITTEYYARELKELAIKRKIERLGLETVNRVRDGISLDQMISGLGQEIDGLKKESTEEKKGMTALESLNTPIVEVPSPVAGGLLVPGRYTIFAATDGEGKTTLCLQLALSAITSTTFLGKFPIREPATVLYFCGENSRGDINEKLEKQIPELEGLLDRDIKKDLKRLILVEPLDVDFLLDKRETAGLLDSWLETYSPEIVIFDPLNNFVSDDESLNNDPVARRTAKALNRLARDFNCFPVLTTHFKKAGEDEPEDIFEKFHGSKYWTNPAASQIAMNRANQQKYPAAKRLHFKFKTVAETSPLLMLRDRESLWYKEITFDQISKAKLVPGDVSGILRRKCKGKAIPSIFEEIAAKELDCSQRQVRELVKAAKEQGLVVKKGSFLETLDYKRRGGPDLPL